MAKLTNQQQLAFISEATSARNLLAYGIRVVRTGAFIDTTRDPILTMLSIGVEKILKLTIGICSLDRNHSWPTKREMRANGHGLLHMYDSVMSELRDRTVDATEYVRQLVADVDADPVLSPTIEALDMYGRMGRFYYLDLLGDAPQEWESPDRYWEKIEAAALAQPELATSHAAAIAQVSDNELWANLYGSLNERIASTIEGLWIMVAVCGRNHALGEAGRVFGFEVHPDAVGRQ